MGDFKRNFDRKGSSRGRFGSKPSGKFERRDSGRGRPSERQEFHSTVCDECGKDCEVPFKPTQGKPIYCDNCFKRNSKDSDSRSEFGKSNNNENLDQINKKLDKILDMLESHVRKEKPKKVEKKE
ncbi:hypothetical protein ISS07_00545 [Candidatus Woesearchaeota archaeon]|nr:hypothetical protein [Candidatus Woesearchaeota archaeon]